MFWCIDVCNNHSTLLRPVATGSIPWLLKKSLKQTEPVGPVDFPLCVFDAVASIQRE